MKTIKRDKGIKGKPTPDINTCNELRIKGCLSHKSDLWRTPKKIYDYFKDNNFFDPCPINPNFDGLKIEWKLYNFVNPPYSQLKKWVEKSILEMKKGKKIILLIPARTDTKAFKMLYESNAKFAFIEGRLKFNESKNSAPFPSMFVMLDLEFKEPSIDLYKKYEILRFYSY